MVEYEKDIMEIIDNLIEDSRDCNQEEEMAIPISLEIKDTSNTIMNEK